MRLKNLVANLFVGSLFVATTPLWMPASLIEQWGTKFSLGSNYSSILEKSYINRAEIYSSAIETIRLNPFGIGMGNFEKYNKEGVKDAHNFLLNITVESGIICGALIAFVLVWSFGAIVISSFKEDFSYYHFSMVVILLVYFLASGVLATTGASDDGPIYYTPFYGVAFFHLLNCSNRKAVILKNGST